MIEQAKPFTPAELAEIERFGTLREVTAERIVATIRGLESERDRYRLALLDIHRGSSLSPHTIAHDALFPRRGPNE